MLLCVLSSDNGNREDCSIFYATYLAIDAKKKDVPKVEAALKKVLGVKSLQSEIKITAGSQAEKLLKRESPKKLIKALKAEGIKAKQLVPYDYIIDTH